MPPLGVTPSESPDQCGFRAYLQEDVLPTYSYHPGFVMTGYDRCAVTLYIYVIWFEVLIERPHFAWIGLP